MEDLYFYIIFLLLMKVTSLIAAAYRFSSFKVSYSFISLSFVFFIVILLRIFNFI